MHRRSWRPECTELIITRPDNRTVLRLFPLSGANTDTIPCIVCSEVNYKIYRHLSERAVAILLLVSRKWARVRLPPMTKSLFSLQVIYFAHRINPAPLRKGSALIFRCAASRLVFTALRDRSIGVRSRVHREAQTWLRSPRR